MFEGVEGVGRWGVGERGVGEVGRALGGIDVGACYTCGARSCRYILR